MLIWWESTKTDVTKLTSTTALDELLNQELAEYEAKEFNVILETWVIDPKNGKKFIKTAVYK